MNLPEGKELLKKFQSLTKSEKQKLIKSICNNKQCADEANEAFEALVSLLKTQDLGLQGVQKCTYNQEEDEEEEEEDEDSDSEEDNYGKSEKRKFYKFLI
jgi:coenzyme F420-reducing hydrogenase alpha subunit